MIKDDIYDIFLAFLCMSSDSPDCPVSQSSIELFLSEKNEIMKNSQYMAWKIFMKIVVFNTGASLFRDLGETNLEEFKWRNWFESSLTSNLHLNGERGWSSYSRFHLSWSVRSGNNSKLRVMTSPALGATHAAQCEVWRISEYKKQHQLIVLLW